MREGDQIIDPKYLEVIRDEEEIALFIQKLVKEEVLIFEVKKENMTLEEAFMKRSGGDHNVSIDEK